MALPRFLRPAVAWCSRTRLFRAVGPTILPPLERMMARLTRGRVQLSGLLLPSLVLHTIGARSGLERDVTLMYCPEPTAHGEQLLVTGSNFARPQHPGWTFNLMKAPDAAVSVHGLRIPVRATLVAFDEREAVWRVLEENWPGYRGYERQSGHVLRIFRLVPTVTGRELREATTVLRAARNAPDAARTTRRRTSSSG
ncbi:nitroreductase/quinone reductase family protein [Lysinimonas soli]|uniref:Nitroreductase/quinone reductase family protein n=1 Tax=Lysinimonas soli TaxID=1074233 RepID=A0ABW0NP96_9MICO